MLHRLLRQLLHQTDLPICFQIASNLQTALKPLYLEYVYVIDFIMENGAGEEIRTLDPHLGKVNICVFYVVCVLLVPCNRADY